MDQESTKIEVSEATEPQSQAIAVIAADETVETGAEAIPVKLDTNQQPSVKPTTTKHRPRSFMGKVKHGKKWPYAQYRKAREILDERTQSNARRCKDKRKRLKQVRIAIGDPMAPFGRGKMNVYRPLRNVQTMTDVETDFVFTFTVAPVLSHSDQLVPMIDQTIAVTRRL
jgi:hypothetical protein